MRRRDVPPGWPEHLPPAEDPEFAAAAVAWLLDVVPGEFRAYEVLRRHPTVLSRFAVAHVRGCLAAVRESFVTARRDLRDTLEADVLDAVLTAYEREGRRLANLEKSVLAVDAAVRGERYVPRL